MPELRIIRNYVGIPDSHTIESYISRGGYTALTKALKMDPDEIVDEIKRPVLGAAGEQGFPPALSGVLYKEIQKNQSIYAVTRMKVNLGVLKTEKYLNRTLIKCLREL